MSSCFIDDSMKNVKTWRLLFIPRAACSASEPSGHARQLKFCNWLNADRYMLFCDEAQFIREEVNDPRNSFFFFCGQRCVHMIEGKAIQRFSVNMWCDVLQNHLSSRDVVQVTFTYTLCARNYLTLLKMYTKSMHYSAPFLMLQPVNRTTIMKWCEEEEYSLTSQVYCMWGWPLWTVIVNSTIESRCKHFSLIFLTYR